MGTFLGGGGGDGRKGPWRLCLTIHWSPTVPSALWTCSYISVVALNTVMRPWLPPDPHTRLISVADVLQLYSE